MVAVEQSSRSRESGKEKWWVVAAAWRLVAARREGGGNYGATVTYFPDWCSFRGNVGLLTPARLCELKGSDTENLGPIIIFR